MEQGSESKSLRNLSLRDMREKSRLSSRMQGNRGHEEHSLRRSSDDDVGRDQYWTTILGYRPHTPRYGDQKGAHGVSAHMRTASESRRSPAQPLRSSHSRPSASGQDSKGSNYGTQAGHSSSQPSSSLAAKPFLCDQCPRRFERRGHLKVHVDAVHELRQPYTCDFPDCLKTFSHRSSLNRHLKGVHRCIVPTEKEKGRY